MSKGPRLFAWVSRMGIRGGVLQRAGMALVVFVAPMGTLAGQGAGGFRANELRRFVGTNLNWIYDGDGLGLSLPGKPSGLADSLVRSLGYTAVRIPGGTLARRFDWRMAVDSPRGVGVDFDDQPQPILTGLPEFKRFAAKYRLTVLYTVNVTDSAAKVVELVDRWNGLPPPAEAPMLFVELGNEDYIHDGSTGGAERYVDRVQPIIRALRTHHPEVGIGAQLASPEGTNWDEMVYRRLAGAVDFWTWHRYGPYSPYDSSAAYEATIRFLAALDRDFERYDAIQTGRRLPIWVTEYNLMYYAGRTYQNVALQPRYYLLHGNFLYLAVKHGVSAMFKCCLVNPSWQAMVDIDSARTRRVALSLTGQVSMFLNQWIVTQDSVAVVPEPGRSAAYGSLMVGRDAGGTLAFLVQNHEAGSRVVNLPVPRHYEWLTSGGLVAHDTGFSTDRPKPTAAGRVRVPGYSIAVIRFRRTAP